MKHVIEYSAAPAAAQFREVDAAELAKIIAEIRLQTEWGAEVWNADIGAAVRAAELQDSEGATVLVARDEDGWYFATARDR